MLSASGASFRQVSIHGHRKQAAFMSNAPRKLLDPAAAIIASLHAGKILGQMQRRPLIAQKSDIGPLYNPWYDRQSAFAAY